MYIQYLRRRVFLNLKKYFPTLTEYGVTFYRVNTEPTTLFIVKSLFSSPRSNKCWEDLLQGHDIERGTLKINKDLEILEFRCHINLFA